MPYINHRYPMMWYSFLSQQVHALVLHVTHSLVQNANTVISADPGQSWQWYYDGMSQQIIIAFHVFLVWEIDNEVKLRTAQTFDKECPKPVANQFYKARKTWHMKLLHSYVA